MKSIDLYLIAGQSNGAGYTKIDEHTLRLLWPQAYEGAENVLYAGRAEHTLRVNTPEVATEANETTWTPARAGQGAYSYTMGAEVGMASVLSQRSDRTAGILKFAHGGTCQNASQPFPWRTRRNAALPSADGSVKASKSMAPCHDQSALESPFSSGGSFSILLA